MSDDQTLTGIDVLEQLKRQQKIIAELKENMNEQKVRLDLQERLIEEQHKNIENLAEVVLAVNGLSEVVANNLVEILAELSEILQDRNNRETYS